MALRQRPVSKTTYRLQPAVAFGLAAILLGGGAFFYLNIGNSFNTIASTITSFPYSESFENTTGDWTQLTGDDFDWTFDYNRTPSSGTGPTGPSEGTYYLYTEATSNFNNTAILESPDFDLSGGSNASFTFKYHMYGSHMGTLDLLASTDGSTWTNVWSLSGDQSNSWNTAIVDLSAYDGESRLILRFSGTTGPSYRSDMAIDDVNFRIDIPYDTDNDGVFNATDLDDDNDGILDTDECPTQQVIRIGYFPDARKHPSDNDYGYTLDGSHMINNSTPKLTNTANFGTAGTVPNTLQLVPITANPVSTSDLNALNLDCIFIGDFTRSGIINGNSSITDAELHQVRDWSMETASHLVIVTQREQEVEWGYTLRSGNTNPVSPTAAGQNTLIFDGPFGAVSNFNQGGSFQGRLDDGAGTVLATEATGKNVIILDDITGDIIIADVDILTNLGGVSSGPNIDPMNGNDVVFGNIWAYAISLITLADADGDGIINSLDLDSDNDGIWDAAEAGHSATISTNGRISGSAAGSGANGFFDGIETSPESGTKNYSIANSETSPDNTYDFLEIDADDDGCYDVRESGPVDQDQDGIVGQGAPTVNSDGLVTGITYATPSNNTWRNPGTINCIGEICGNGIDDDKNGIVDDNSPGGTANNGVSPVLWFDAADQSTVTTSGTNVTGWTDKTGSIPDLSVSRGSPQYTSEINFNAVINFTGDEMSGADVFEGSTDEMHIFYVSKENVASNNWLVSLNGTRTGNNMPPTTTSRFSFHGPWKNTRSWYFDPGNARTNGERSNTNSGATNVGDVTLMSAYKSVSGGKNGFRVNGGQATVESAIATTGYTQDGIRIGRSVTDHDIAEIIAYDSKLSATDEMKVETYLGIKYGITMYHNYISSGGVVLWDTVANSGYNKMIAGIGKDDCSGLAQFKSQSVTTGSMLRIEGNSSNIDDGEFLIWGADGGQAGAFGEHDFPSESQGRLARDWRCKMTGDVGPVNIQFDLTGLGNVVPSDLQLLIDTDNDGSFIDESTSTGGVRIGAIDKGSNVYSFDGITVGAELRIGLGTSNKITTSLPIELARFDADLMDDYVLLSWATEAEVNNDYFTIEKTSDMMNWDIVTMVDGAGNSTSTLQYMTQDDDPLPGVSYYRLKQTDFDGAFTYSDVRTIRNDKTSSAELNVYPIPARDFINVEYGGNDLAQFEVMLVNMAGQIVKRQIIPSNTSIYRMDLSGLKTGVYNISVVKGDMKLQKKIMVESY